MKLTRISEDNYKITGNELQRHLIEEDVIALLEEYDEVDDTNILKSGMIVRYYTITHNKNGSINKKFRLGGTIIKVDHENKYLVLGNGRISWSVQFNNSIFYKKMSLDDVKDFYENELDKKDIKIKKLKKINNKLIEENNQLKSVIKKYIK